MKKAEKKLKKVRKVTFGDTQKVEKSLKIYFFGILKVKKVAEILESYFSTYPESWKRLEK